MFPSPSTIQTKSGQTSPTATSKSRPGTGTTSGDKQYVLAVLAENDKNKKRAKDFECAVRANIGQAGSRRARRGHKMSTLTPADPRLKKVFPETNTVMSEGSINHLLEDRLSILTSSSPRSEALLQSLSSPDKQMIVKTPELGRLCPIPPASTSPNCQCRLSSMSWPVSVTPQPHEANFEPESLSFTEEGEANVDESQELPIRDKQSRLRSASSLGKEQTKDWQNITSTSTTSMQNKKSKSFQDDKKSRPATAKATRVRSSRIKRKSGQPKPSFAPSAKKEKISRPTSADKQTFQQRPPTVERKPTLSAKNAKRSRSPSAKMEKTTLAQLIQARPLSVECKKMLSDNKEKEFRPPCAETEITLAEQPSQIRAASAEYTGAPSTKNRKQFKPPLAKPIKSSSSPYDIEIKQNKLMTTSVDKREPVGEAKEIDLVVNGKASKSQVLAKTSNLEQSKADDEAYRKYVRFVYSKCKPGKPEMIVSGTAVHTPKAHEINTSKRGYENLKKRDQGLLGKFKKSKKGDADAEEYLKELNEANCLLAHLEHDRDSLEEQKYLNMCMLNGIKNAHRVLIDEKAHLQKKLNIAKKAYDAQQDKCKSKVIERLSSRYEKLDNKEKVMRRRIAILEDELSLIISKLKVPHSKQVIMVPPLNLSKINERKALPPVNNAPEAPRIAVGIQSVAQENLTDFNSSHQRRVKPIIPKVSTSAQIMQNEEFIKPAPTILDNRTHLPAISSQSVVMQPVRKCVKQVNYELKSALVKTEMDTKTEEPRLPDIVKGSQFIDTSKIIPKPLSKKGTLQKRPPSCAQIRASAYFPNPGQE